jgi:hypothetical protein
MSTTKQSLASKRQVLLRHTAWSRQHGAARSAACALGCAGHDRAHVGLATVGGCHSLRAASLLRCCLSCCLLLRLALFA